METGAVEVEGSLVADQGEDGAGHPQRHSDLQRQRQTLFLFVRSA